MSSVQGRVNLSSFWVHEEFGITEPNPFDMPLNSSVEYITKKTKLLYEKFGQFDTVQKEPEMVYPALRHDWQNIFACAYGRPYPTWDSFFRSNRPLKWFHFQCYSPHRNISQYHAAVYVILKLNCNDKHIVPK